MQDQREASKGKIRLWYERMKQASIIIFFQVPTTHRSPFKAWQTFNNERSPLYITINFFFIFLKNFGVGRKPCKYYIRHFFLILLLVCGVCRLHSGVPKFGMRLKISPNIQFSYQLCLARSESISLFLLLFLPQLLPLRHYEQVLQRLPLLSSQLPLISSIRDFIRV